MTVNLPDVPSEATEPNFLCYVDKNVPLTSDEDNIFANLVYNNGQWSANEISISDAKTIYIPTDIRANTVSYTRNFGSTNWQALYLPFAMKYEDWADKAKVAYINNVHQYDDDEDGVIDRTVLEFITQKSGSIEPNVPYVVKPMQTGEVTFISENVTLTATPATDGFIDCMSTSTKYTIYGTYQGVTDMYSSGYYAMRNGDFMQAESDAVTLAPFRTYLEIESRNGAGTMHHARCINIMVDGIVDNGATGIVPVVASGNGEAAFNLSGQKVGSNYKGIVVRNGRKFITK